MLVPFPRKDSVLAVFIGVNLPSRDYTPKHGSWLNMAEIELSVLNRQCLDRRIPDQETLKREVATWEVSRNRQTRTVDWQFTTEDARIKLKQLYPSFIS